MTRFLDGPAAGVTLSLRRAPKLLRVVSGPKGWDALDQLRDAPSGDEKVTVYVRVTEPFTVHVDYRGKDGRRLGEWYQGADYRVSSEQPDDATLRSRAAWEGWAVSHG